MSELGKESIGKQMAGKLEEMYASEAFGIFWRAYVYALNGAALMVGKTPERLKTSDEVAMNLNYRQGYYDGAASLGTWKNDLVKRLREGTVPWAAKEEGDDATG